MGTKEKKEIARQVSDKQLGNEKVLRLLKGTCCVRVKELH